MHMVMHNMEINVHADIECSFHSRAEGQTLHLVANLKEGEIGMLITNKREGLNTYTISCIMKEGLVYFLL